MGVGHWGNKTPRDLDTCRNLGTAQTSSARRAGVRLQGQLHTLSVCLLWLVVVVFVCLLHIEWQINYSISKEKTF